MGAAVRRPLLFWILLLVALSATGCLWGGCGASQLNYSYMGPPKADTTKSGIVRDWLTDYGPLSPRLSLEYYVADSSDVLLRLLKADTTTVDTLVNSVQGPGYWEAHPTGRVEIPAGVYRWILQVAGHSETKPTFVSGEIPRPGK